MQEVQVSPQRRTLLTLAALVPLALTWLAMLAYGAGPLDQYGYGLLYAGHRPFLAALAHGLTAAGEPTVLIAATALSTLWLWRRGRGRLGLSLLVVILLGRALGELQKYLIARPRPSLEPHLVVVKSQSFPSGHAMSSMIFYLSLALALSWETRWRVPAVLGAILLSLMIGTSRVMLGVHWPSDVIGGWAFGLAWVLVALAPVEHRLRAS